jgi:hypothetical protein
MPDICKNLLEILVIKIFPLPLAPAYPVDGVVDLTSAVPENIAVVLFCQPVYDKIVVVPAGEPKFSENIVVCAFDSILMIISKVTLNNAKRMKYLNLVIKKSNTLITCIEDN